MYTATSSQELRFHFLDRRDMTPIGYDKVSKETGKSVDPEDLAASWDPERYHDRYRNELLDLLRKKAKGKPLPEPAAEEEGEVVDLMDALRQSVEATQAKQARTRKTSSSRKKAASRKAS